MSGSNWLASGCMPGRWPLILPDKCGSSGWPPLSLLSARHGPDFSADSEILVPGFTGSSNCPEGRHAAGTRGADPAPGGDHGAPVRLTHLGRVASLGQDSHHAVAPCRFDVSTYPRRGAIRSTQSRPTDPTDPVAESDSPGHQCGRCRQRFPAGAECIDGTLQDRWLCSPCRVILLGDTR